MSEPSIDDRDRIEEILETEYPTCTYTIEDDVVWVSGMHSHCEYVAHSMAATLAHLYDIPTSLVYEDDADRPAGVQFNWGESA